MSQNLVSQNLALQQRKEKATPRGVGVLNQFFIERAQNAELWDVEGRRFIDFCGGIAVVNVGHRHPKVVAAIKAQADKFIHSCYQVVPYESYISLAEKINAMTPGTHAKKTAFFTTGAEAVENAIKIARYAAKRSGVIAFSAAFHGRSLFALSLTGKVQPYKAGFGAMASEVYHIPYPCHCSSLADTQKALSNLFKSDIEPSRVAAIIFEPVQGEGGFNPIQAQAVTWLRQVCDEHGIILIADEVQTGFGRTGKMFAMEHFPSVIPDLMVVAKSLAGGTTLSAVCGRAEVMDAPLPGGLGGTYAGNPLAVAAAHAVIEVMEEEKLVERGAKLGAILVDRLNALKPKVAAISDVRGLGAMIALEFRDPKTGAPLADMAKKVQSLALTKGLILLTCGTEGNAIRFLFPLSIPEAVFNEGLAITEAAILGAM